MKIDKKVAADSLRAEARRLKDEEPANAAWEQKIEELSRLCEAGVSKTHIAFLGTAILAKTVDSDADLFAIKPEHADGNLRAFSARTLCHSVLVPLSAELGFSLGVTGREPLNNQPYFRMTRLDDGTPVHAGGRVAFDYMVQLVRELDATHDSGEARSALRAFVKVRSGYQPRYVDHDGGHLVESAALADLISRFVRDDSERGKRAQAVVAGLVDVFAGPDRVESGRINDPSRRHPGDVCVRAASGEGAWEKAIEVRDKPVSSSDVFVFGKKCIDMGVREAAVAMFSERQQLLDEQALQRWAGEFGIGLTLFYGWTAFVEQALFWSELPKPVAAGRAATHIHERLVAVEASSRGVELWNTLIKQG